MTELEKMRCKIKMDNSYYSLDKIVDKKDKIIFYYKEKWNKSFKKVVMYKEKNYIICDLRNSYKNIYIKCFEKDLSDEINKYSFHDICIGYEFIQRNKKQEEKRLKNIKRKEKLLKVLKKGDYVERYGKTPNLGLYVICVDKITDYGISGFYIWNNNKCRTNEYTTVSWDYIKGIWSE